MLSAIARLPHADSAALQGWLGRAAAAAALLLAVLLGDRLAALVWALVPLPEQTAPALPAVAAAGGASRGEEGGGYQRIAGWHLFGEVPKAPTTPPPAPVQVPESVPATQLRLDLRGVFHYPDVSRQRAIIAGQDGREDVYAIGDSLPGGAILEDIGPQRVVLSRQGQMEALSFPEEGQRLGLGQPATGAAPVSETTTRIDATALAGRYRENMENDPTALADIAQVQPYIEAGAFRGFRLRPGRQANLLRQLGLRPGDVVTSVNGVPLDSMAQAMEALRNLAESDQVEVIILRNGRDVPYSFQLN